jgi:hypothetical protein
MDREQYNKFFETLNFDKKLDEKIFDFRPVSPGTGWDSFSTKNRSYTMMKDFTTDEVFNALVKCDTAGYNCYMTVNPREYINGTIKGNKDFIREQWAVHLDWDDISPQDALDKLVAKGIYPTAIVETSPNCVHIWIRLKSPFLIKDKLGVVAGTNWNKRLNAFVGGGDHCYDCTRVLRIPGTSNFPDARKIAKGRTVVPVKLFYANPIAYSLRFLNKLFPQLAIPVKQIKVTTTKVELNCDAAMHQAYNWLYRNLERHLEEEKKTTRSPKGQRECATMRRLINDYGLSGEVALDIYRMAFSELNLPLDPYDDAEYWEGYCSAYCDSEVGNKVYTQKQLEQEMATQKTLLEVERMQQMATSEEYNEAEDDDRIQRYIDDREDGLPETFTGTPIWVQPPPDIWEGLVQHGSKVLISGPSKSRKSWTTLGLSLAIATGKPYWGLATARKKVCFCNFEIKVLSFANRVSKVSEALNLTDADTRGWFYWMNLRGYGMDAAIILPRIAERVKRYGYEIVVLDPIYKMLGDADENSAGDIAKLMNSFESFCETLGVTLIITHHFAKGNSSNKNTIDRMSGSGVFARDPDTVIQLTPHEEDNTLVVSPILRDHIEMPDFCVRWQYPLLVRDATLNPKKLYNAGKKKEQFDINDILIEISKSKTAMTIKDIATVLKCSSKTVRLKLEANTPLTKIIPIKGNGPIPTNTYVLTDKGKQLVGLIY